MAFQFGSCRKPKPNDSEVPIVITNAFLILNEGLFQHNNSELTYFNWNTHQQHDHMFEAKNEWGMGDTGNDMGIYGEKLYIAMNNSHIIHVLNRRTGRLFHQISLSENGIGASPRSLAFHNGKIYVSAFNGYLYKIDTTTFGIENKIQLGSNPDQMVLLNNELWVSNSGGLTELGDSTVSVIDLLNFSEIQRITVGRNPGSIVSDGSNRIFVVSRGNYTNIPSKLLQIDALSKTVVLNENKTISSLKYFGNQLYALGYDYQTSSSSLRLIDPSNFEYLSGNLIEHLPLQTLYNMDKLSVFGQQIYVFLDARQFIHQGKVLVCDLNFNLLFEFTVGLNPTKLIYNED